MATIRKHGNRWQARVRRQGHPTLTRSFTLRDDATRWAREQEIAVDRGETFKPSAAPTALSATPPIPPSDSQTTIGQLLDRYTSEVIPKKRSAPAMGFHIRVLSRHDIAKVEVAKLTGADIAELRDTRSRSVSPATVVKEVGILIRMLKVAQEDWSIDVPVLATRLPRMPKVSNARDRRLSKGELEALQDALIDNRNPLIRPSFLFALATGMRRGEVLSLRWSNIDLKLNTAFLEMTKNGDSRSVPLSPRALQALEMLPATEGNHKPSDLVFPISANALRLSWERLKKRAGIEDLRWHDLRHEAISRFFELGLSIPEVSLISGHKDPRMLFRYTHLRAADVATKLHKLTV